MKNCPHCGKLLASKPDYDPNDSVQKRGYDDTVWNITEGSFGHYRQNEYPEGSSEYYRWNRGYHAAMKSNI